MSELQTRSAQGLEWSPSQVMQQIRDIQTLMKEAMMEGEHFGSIPGTDQKKKVLLKAGAEKLGLMFRLAPKYEATENIMSNGHLDVKVKCSLYHIVTGAFWGEGYGSCSTMETKYRYRTGQGESTGVTVPKQFWDLRRAGKSQEAMELIGGKGYTTKKGDDGLWYICEKIDKQENPDIADTYNTVRKIATKRAFVASIISATAASDIFTQDIDQSDEVEKPVVESPKKAPESFITHDEQLEILRVAKEKKVDINELKAFLKEKGISGSAKIPKGEYENVYAWIIQHERDATNG